MKIVNLMTRKLGKASPAPPRRRTLLELAMDRDLQAQLWKLNMQPLSPP